MSSQRAAKSSSASGTAGSAKQVLAQAANNLQALHQEQVARATSLALPNLSAQHSDSFLQLASFAAAPGTAVAPSLRHRRTLWGDEVPNITHSHQPNVRLQNSAPRPTPKAASEVLPDWYNLHNRRCPRCRLPLIPGVNSLRYAQSGKPRENRRATQDSGESATMVCGLCEPLHYRGLAHPTRTAAKRPDRRRRKAITNGTAGPALYDTTMRDKAAEAAASSTSSPSSS